MTEGRIGKPGNQGDRVQVSRITKNQDTSNLFDNCRESSTNRPFLCRTKPISEKVQMSATSILTDDYDKIGACGVEKSKAKQSQFARETKNER